MRRYIAFILILFSSLSAFAAENNSPTFAMTGDVVLTSHYVEYGLSQSDKSPALQGSFWFNFGPQFRLGLWGSNTNYEHSDDHFNLRGIGELNISFSQTSHMALSYTASQYYNGGERNGSILGVHFNFWSDYRVTYDGMSNWEGTDHRSTRFGFGKTFTIFTSWKWDLEGGYNNPNVDSINPYFDARTGIGTKWGPIFFEGAVTGTSESSQFNGAGDFFFILSAKTDL
jgi:uncharacterized protein (TIGR02001 family)